MAHPEHLLKLQEGVEAWNSWRNAHPEVIPDLSGADLHAADLRGINFGMEDEFLNMNQEERIRALFDTNRPPKKVNLSNANLAGANLSKADLRRADLSRAYLWSADLSQVDLSHATLFSAHLEEANLRDSNLSHASLHRAYLPFADLSGADLSKADMVMAMLGNANLKGANLKEANLTGAILVELGLENADLTGCTIYGCSVWNLNIDKNTKQSNLIITRHDEPTITVDDLEVAQFIYLLLNRKKLKDVLNTITSKAVLLLGRFTPERKAVLDALADELRKHNLLPIIFDFERSTNRDFTETIKILAGLSLFVIVDITKPKSAPQELTATVPDYQIPFVPILEEGNDPYSMFEDFKKYDWVLKPILKYPTKEVLSKNFRGVILERAWNKHLELQRKKNQELEVMSIEDLILQKQASVSS